MRTTDGMARPVSISTFASGLNLPFGLAVLLIAATRPRLIQGYRHPRWMLAAGWLVVVVVGGMSLASLFHAL